MTSIARLTSELATFTATLKLDNVPSEAIQIACSGFIDCFGVMLAGSSQPAVTKLVNSIGNCQGHSPIFCQRTRMHPAHAAWINATAAHVLDWDDAALRGHPSAVLVPAILSEA